MMNNIQLYLTIGIPTITVVLAWLSSRSDNNRTNDKIDRQGESLHTKMDRLGENLNAKMDSQGTSLRAEMSSLRAEMVALRNDHHKDNLALMAHMIPLHERMAKLESQN
jgi:hypothetical protein